MNEYETAWQDFERSGKVAGATVEHDRAPKEMRYHLLYLLSLAHDRRTVETARSLQRELAFPYVDPIPEQNLHVSIQALDLPQPLWAEERDRIIAQSSQALSGLAPFAVPIGGANSFATAAFLEVHDNGKIREMRARLRQALPDLFRDDPFVRDGKDYWLPHLSVAYYTADHDSRAVIKVLKRDRSTATFEALVCSIQLVGVSGFAGLNRWRWPIEATFG